MLFQKYAPNYMVWQTIHTYTNLFKEGCQQQEILLLLFINK